MSKYNVQTNTKSRYANRKAYARLHSLKRNGPLIVGIQHRTGKFYGVLKKINRSSFTIYDFEVSREIILATPDIQQINSQGVNVAYN